MRRISSVSQVGARLTLVIGTVVALASLTAPVLAQPSTSSTAMARDFFRQGLQHVENEEWELAADRFRRSLRLRRSPVVAFNLGTAYAHLGRLVEAAELFRRAAREGQGELVEAARAELADVQPRLGSLTIHVEGPQDGVQLQIDGRPLAAEVLGAPIPADPGTRSLRALRAEEVVAEASVEVTARETAEVTLEIPPPEAPSPEQTAQQAAGGGTDAAPVLATTEGVGENEDGDDTVLWVVLITSIVLAAGAGVGIAVWLTQSDPDPVDGNLLPGTLEFGQ